jgi:tripartite-type tricarboxylate transporter receptor subunit TctC
MGGELFKFMAGIDMVRVPYRGSPPALNDLLGGQVHVYFAPIAASIEHVKAGKLRALAVTAATRFDALPNIPSMSEVVPGYESSAFYGIGVPKNVPAYIIDKLNKEINAGLADPKVRKRLAELGSSPFCRLDCRIRQVHCRGNREVGESDQVRQYANIKPE